MLLVLKIEFCESILTKISKMVDVRNHTVLETLFDSLVGEAHMDGISNQ